MKLSLLSVLPAAVLAKDPAEGWLGYATGVNPAGGDAPLTFVEAYWHNCDDPKEGGAFFSPWFGIETSDNLNLIQPVNPWTGDSWAIYNEYFQWSPEHNEDSAQYPSKAGDLLYGSVTLDAANNEYVVVHKDLTTGSSVTSTIPIQKKSIGGGLKTYNIVYFVFEKEASCRQYPPDGEVTFFNITVEYGGQKVTPTWTTAYVDDVCNNRAHIVDEATIKITWDTSMDNGKAQKVALTGLHSQVNTTNDQLGNCKKDSYVFCCGIGTPCDCSQGSGAPGQCKEASYDFCCLVGTPCDCTQPPVEDDTTDKLPAMLGAPRALQDDEWVKVEPKPASQLPVVSEPKAMPVVAVEEVNATEVDGLGNCNKDAYLFCCGIGTVCDCSQGSGAPGQCKEASYDYCCLVGTPCDCTQPPMETDAPVEKLPALLLDAPRALEEEPKQEPKQEEPKLHAVDELPKLVVAPEPKPVAVLVAEDNLGNCKKDSYIFCCGVGTPCDCTKGAGAPGQCEEASYDFCCLVGTPCDCTQPPVDDA